MEVGCGATGVIVEVALGLRDMFASYSLAAQGFRSIYMYVYILIVRP